MVDIADKPFTQLLNLNLIDELRIQGILVLPGGGQDIVRTAINYSQELDDDVIIGTGNITISLISLSTAIKEIIIRSNGASTLTITPDGTDTTEVATVLPDTSVTLIPNLTEWLLI